MIRRSYVGLVSGLLFLVPCTIRAEDQSFDSNGVNIRYLVQGKGEPVMLIHGFTATIEMQWGLPGIIKDLAKEFQVIAFDNRGHGKSGKPHDPKKYGVEMVEDAVRLLDHLKIKKAHVVGYSMGAIITAKLVAAHPERILSATLGGAGAIRGDVDLSFFDVLADSLDQGKGIGPLLVALTPEGRPKPTEDQLKIMNQLLAATNDPKALAAVVRSWKDLAVSDENLKANHVPAQALIGGIDPLKKGVDELKERMPDLKVVVIDGADHMNAFIRPEFIKNLRDFLAKNGANGQATDNDKSAPNDKPR
jgi:pimeloyl-ACP methyl ester carboxylesterase